MNSENGFFPPCRGNICIQTGMDPASEKVRDFFEKSVRRLGERCEQEDNPPCADFFLHTDMRGFVHKSTANCCHVNSLVM